MKIELDDLTESWHPKKHSQLPYFKILTSGHYYQKVKFSGAFSNFLPKSSRGQNRWPRVQKMAVSQFHGVPCKKLLGLNPQTEMSTMSGTLKLSKTRFGEFHYVKFWHFEAGFGFESELLVLLMVRRGKWTTFGDILTTSDLCCPQVDKKINFSVNLT